MAKVDVVKLKVKLQLKDPFLGSIATQVKWVEDSEIAVAGTDGTTLYYNDDGLGDYILEEQIGIIAHECLHVALQHSSRAANIEVKNQKLYNLAADIVVNNELLANKFTLPEDAVVYSFFRNYTTEQVYYYLYTENPSNDNSLPDKYKDIQPNSQNKKELKNILINANNCKGCSKICSEEFSREFNNLINPKLPWTNILRNYVNDLIKDNYSWKRPNRRYEEEILPSIATEDALTHLFVYVDVSGSIEDEVLNDFISEIKKLHNDLPIEHIRLQFFSTGLFSTTDIYNEWVNPKIATSGGGTDIWVVIKDILKNRPTVSVIFTDGCFGVDYLKLPNITPIVWLIRDNQDFKTNKGKIIEISEKH